MECDVNGCTATAQMPVSIMLPGHGDALSREVYVSLCSDHRAQRDEFGSVSGLTVPDNREQYIKNNTLV